MRISDIQIGQMCRQAVLRRKAAIAVFRRGLSHIDGALCQLLQRRIINGGAGNKGLFLADHGAQTDIAAFGALAILQFAHTA